jgi:putative secretion ATPase (PEP-CTERM system associated)
MYEKFYNLSARPFQLTPDPRFYFSSRTHKKAMAYLTYGLHQGEGFIVVTGDIGTGKTTLLRHLFSTLDHDEYVAAMLVSTQLGGIGLLRGVASAFGLNAEGDKGQLLMRIERFLRENYKNGKRVLLIVDEAQNLSIQALEELRMLSNFQEGDNALVQSFLVGQPEFRDMIFGAPELEQLRQRVIATHHLGPMEKEELADYLEHRLSLVGWQGDPGFTIDAVAAIYDYAAGVPRKLNTLCSRVMLFGALEELHEISGETVRTVIADMSSDTELAEPPKQQKSGSIASEANSGGRIDQLETIISQQHQMIGQLTELMAKLVHKDVRDEAPDDK